MNVWKMIFRKPFSRKQTQQQKKENIFLETKLNFSLTGNYFLLTGKYFLLTKKFFINQLF